MTGNKVLLDTNAFSYMLRGEESIRETVNESSRIYLSIFVIGELLSGFRSGSKESENRNLLQRFINKATVELINADYQTAEIFSEVKSILKNQGTPIPINDVWIASHTIQTGSQLVTFDKHFNNIPGLRIRS